MVKQLKTIKAAAIAKKAASPEATTQLKELDPVVGDDDIYFKGMDTLFEASS